MWVVWEADRLLLPGTLEKGAQAYPHPVLFFENTESHSNLCVHYHGLLFWQQIISKRPTAQKLG